MNFATTAITYKLSSGRLGDQLIYYCIAQAIAFKHELSFYAKPFASWDQLVLSQKNRVFHENNFNGFDRIYIRNEKEFLQKCNPHKNQLFIIDDTHWDTSSPDSEWYGVESSKFFRTFIKTLIAPIKPIPSFKFPPGCLTVALHYRTGEGYDDQHFLAIQKNENNMNPKFRPFGYYIAQIKEIRRFFPSEKLYIHIFTDAIKPLITLKAFESQFSDPNIIFTIRTEQNSWKKNTIIDLFHMSQFDCLIRPRSCYSFIAQLIGSHKLIMHPKGALWINKHRKSMDTD